MPIDCKGTAAASPCTPHCIQVAFVIKYKKLKTNFSEMTTIYHI